MSTTEFNPDALKEEIKNLIRQERKGNAVKMIVNIAASQKLLDKEFYDLVGEVIRFNQQYFMEKMYPKFYKNISRLFNSNQMYEMEQYILEKFSFYSGEKLLDSFNGKTVQKDTQVAGRVYLTNYRIIAHGKFGPTPGSSLAAAGAGAAGGTGSQTGTNIGASMALNEYIQKRVQKRLQEYMSHESSEGKSCFGYQYPIIDSYNVARKAKNLSYRVDIEFEKKGKLKRKTLKMKIVPKKELAETSNVFNNRRKQNLTLIENNLK